MFYRPEDGHGLKRNPWAALVTPRPIGWISSRGGTGDNLAPYSFFNIVAYSPPQIVFSSTGVKDSLTNIRETGVFCANVVEEAMMETANATSAEFGPGVDEFARCGVPRAECETIPCPRVAGAPASIEARVVQIVDLRGEGNHLVIGEATGIHLRDDCIVDGRFDVTRFRPVARMGYLDFAVVREVRALPRPKPGDQDGA